MTTPGGHLIRRARPGERERLIDFMIGGRAHVSGSRDRAVFAAILRDSWAPRPRTTVAVAEAPDGAVVATLLAVNGDLPRYYRTLPLRHPLGAAGLVRHRLRKLPGRLRGRRHARAVDPSGEAAHPLAATPLVDEPRLRQPPREPEEPGPHAADRGPHISFCLHVLVAADQRGQGLGRAMVTASLHHLRAVGATRYDCSFAPEDRAACRMYLSMPFDIQRFPAGYFASIDLGDLEPRELAP